MGGKSAIDLDAEMARRRAEIFLARLAGRAFAAADPGKHRGRRADFYVRIGAGLLDHARDLVAERERKRAADAVTSSFLSPPRLK